MKLSSINFFAFLLFVLTLLVFASCSNNDSVTNPNPPGNNGGIDSTIDITGFKYSPTPDTVKVGTTVAWTNMDSAPHTVTSDDGKFTSSGNMSQGNKYSYKFTVADAYSYHCAYHSSMKASIIVIP